MSVCRQKSPKRSNYDQDQQRGFDQLKQMFFLRQQFRMEKQELPHRRHPDQHSSPPWCSALQSPGPWERQRHRGGKAHAVLG